MKSMIETFVICKQPGRYIGWPSIAMTREGELLVGFSGDREAHVCPFGKTQMVRSKDHGRTWSGVETITDCPLDDRDVGLVTLKSGTIVLTWFTSLAFEEGCWGIPEARLAAWRPHTSKITDADRKQWLGNWSRRSTDAGRTWDEPVRNHVFAPHGPIQLQDGRLVYLGVGTAISDIKVDESRDEGQSWTCINSEVIPADLKPMMFDEPHLVEVEAGKLLAMYRLELDDLSKRFLWQAESADAGRTWSRPHPTPIWGFPPHLLKLRDGRLLVTYSRRMEPFGERACLSSDGGKTWDIAHEIILSNSPSSDLGYPASIELPNGQILTIYYQIDQPGEKPCLMGSIWRID